jgi:hypothetical protein
MKREMDVNRQNNSSGGIVVRARQGVSQTAYRGGGLKSIAHLATLMAISLLAIATACSPSTVQAPPPTAEVADVAGTSSVNSMPILISEPSSQVSAAQLVSTSPRSTPGHVWAEPFIDADMVKILQSVAAESDHVHFEVPTDDGPAGFIGYFLDKSFVVRANVCPVCVSRDMDWEASTIVCGSCGTVFDAVSGIEKYGGPRFPKGLVPNTKSAGIITMSLVDLQSAFERSVSRESELLEAVEEPPAGNGLCCGAHP